MCYFDPWYTYARKLYNPFWYDDMDPASYDYLVENTREYNQVIYGTCTFCGRNHPQYKPDLFEYSFLTARIREIRHLAASAIVAIGFWGDFDFTEFGLTLKARVGNAQIKIRGRVHWAPRIAGRQLREPDELS